MSWSDQLNIEQQIQKSQDRFTTHYKGLNKFKTDGEIARFKMTKE
jgi:hypothetical protein